MGKEKQFPGKLSRILKEKRVLAFPLLLIAIIAFGLVLQGCEQTMEENGVPIEEITIEPVKEETVIYKCGDSGDDLISVLPGLGGENGGDIQVEICIPGGKNNITIDADPLSEAKIEDALAVNEPFTITRLITYFQVKDADGELITHFNPPLEMQVMYTAEAWEAAIDEKYERPRVAYLIWKDASWADTWVEFTDLSFIPPGTDGDPHGYLQIIIEELDDPLIGGL